MGRILAGLLLLVACQRDGPNWAGQQGSTNPAAEQTAIDTGSAVIRGTVSVEGTPPASPAIDMSSAPGCLAYFAGGSPTDFRINVKNGKLMNAFVYVKSGLRAGHTYAPTPTEPAVATHECRIHPRIFGVMVGQRFIVQNGDTVAHHMQAVSNVGNQVDVALPHKGASEPRTFANPEVMVTLKCQIHPWMQSWMAALDHPFFATTGDDGAFEIKGLPAGKYELEVWHPYLGRRSVRVQVGSADEAIANFNFTVSAQ